MAETYRRAGADDLPALNALIQASRAYEGRYRAMLDGYAITAAQADRDLIVLVEADGEVAGFYSLIVEGEPELDLMFVADAAQGGGLGARLFGHMRREAMARGMTAVKIVSHPPSVGFYEKMGAHRVGETAPAGRIDWVRPILSLDVAQV